MRFLVIVCALVLACGGDDDVVGDAGARTGVDAGAVDGADSGSPAVTDAGAANDGGSTPTIDAGPDFCDSPAAFGIEVVEPGECDALVPCGGDLVGTWDFSGGCVEVPIEEAVMRCPGATVVRREGTATGCVTFTPTIARRVATGSVEVEAFFPALCTAFFSCDMLQSTFRMTAPDTECTEDDSGCTCLARLAIEIDDTDFYRSEGNQIVSTTSGRRWDYCIEGDALSYTDATVGTTREPGIYDLASR